MNQKTLSVLTIGALLAIVAAIVLDRSNAPRREEGGSSEYLVPELRDHLNDVDKIVITTAGGHAAATLQRTASDWNLQEKGGYVVDTGKLREFLLKLAGAKKLESKTSSAQKYAAIGVEDIALKDAKGAQVEIDGLAQTVALIIGNSDAHGDTYIRRAGDRQSWLVSGALSVGKNATDWLRKDLIDIPAARVASVNIARADGKSVRIEKAAANDANFKLLDVPKGREAAAPFTIDGLASMFAGLRFDDVEHATLQAAPEHALKAHYALFDGLFIDITAWQKDGKNYAQFTAGLDSAQADKNMVVEQNKSRFEFETASAAAAKVHAPEDAKALDTSIKPLAVSDAAKDRDNRLSALNQELADLNAQFAGWTFVLPAYKYASINKSPEDLLQPLPEKNTPAKPSEVTKGRVSKSAR